jgi:uncharacterized RDD family membrane protein YckC
MSSLPPSDAGGAPPPPPPPAPPYPSTPAYPSSYPVAPVGYPAAPTIGPAGGYGPMPGLVYAGFGARFLGYLLDSLIVFAVEAVISIPFVVVAIFRFYQDHPVVPGQSPATLPADISARFALVGVIGAVLSALYYGGLVAWQGRTVGQRAVGAFVVRAEDGGRLPTERALLRAAIFWGPGVLGLIPVLGTVSGLLALIGLLSVAWDPRKQGWHDKLGRSLVVKRTGPR